MITQGKIIEIYCIADDFCKEFDQEIKKHRLARAHDGKKRKRSVIETILKK